MGVQVRDDTANLLVRIAVQSPTISDLLQHEEDCTRFVGSPHSQVHRWLDEPFGLLGAAHRRARHHRQGIEECRRIFGGAAALAAAIHILRDCQEIPDRDDYERGLVDPLGYRVDRTVEEIVMHSELEFDKVATGFSNDEHKCLLLIGWLENVPQLLQLVKSAIADPRSDVQSQLLGEWEKARATLLSDKEGAKLDTSSEPPDAKIAFEAVSPEAVQELGDTANSILQNLRGQLGSVDFGWLAVADLVNPLQLIDLDYANHLASEIPEQPNENEAMAFAAPERLNIIAQALSDTRSATILTKFQELYVSAIESHHEPAVGFEIRFRVSPLPQYILVIEHEGRYFLRSGMHRAFVLARAGLQRIPCFLARNVEMPTIVGPYPVYPTEVLHLPRPPMLVDAFDDRLAVKKDFQQSRRLLRISTEDIVIPVI